jgi:hypothetical protein
MARKGFRLDTRRLISLTIQVSCSFFETSIRVCPIESTKCASSAPFAALRATLAAFASQQGLAIASRAALLAFISFDGGILFVSVSDDARAAAVREAEPDFTSQPTLSTLERRTQLAYLISGAVIIALIFFYLQYSTKAICCGDFDGYYHFRWARMLWENFRDAQSLPAFDSLPLTTLNPRDYVDHHFLFHVMQIPFTWISADQHVGAKISAWFYASLAVFACYWLIVRYRLRFTLLWLLAPARFIERVSLSHEYDEGDEFLARPAHRRTRAFVRGQTQMARRALVRFRVGL